MLNWSKSGKKRENVRFIRDSAEKCAEEGKAEELEWASKENLEREVVDYSGKKKL